MAKELSIITSIKQNALKAIVGVAVTSFFGGAVAYARLNSSAITLVFADNKRIDSVEQQLKSDFVRSNDYNKDNQRLSDTLSNIEKSINSNTRATEKNNELIIQLLQR